MRRLVTDWLWLLVFLAFFIGFAFGAWSVSNDAPPQQQAQRAENTEHSSDAPASVNQTHPEQKASNGEEKEKHSIWSWLASFFELKLTDAIIAAFTIVLAVKTSGLFVETAGLRSAADRQAIDMQDSIKAAKAAADAAVDAARIARNAERPYFSPFVPELRNWIEVIETKNVFQILEVHLDITNIGKGIGFIDSYGIAHEFCFDGQQGGLPLAIRNQLGRVPLRADSRWEAGAPFENIQIETPERLAALLDFRTTLFVYGYVRYYDLFGIFRKTGFMFQFIPDADSPDESTFAIVPHAMWYDEEEKPQG